MLLTLFLQIPLGGKFEWQTGYGYSDFVSYFPIQVLVNRLLMSSFLVVLFLNIFLLIRNKLNISKIYVFLSSVLVVFSLMFLWVDDLVPRYFLTTIPPVLLMISISINDWMLKFQKNNYLSKLVLIVPVLLSVYWTIFNIKYDMFIKTYTYPSGMMTDAAQTPYKLFKMAMDDLDVVARGSGCNKYRLTNNSENQNYDLWMETKYVWEYIYKYDYTSSNETINNCSYLITNWEVKSTQNLMFYKKYGLYFIYKFIN